MSPAVGDDFDYVEHFKHMGKIAEEDRKQYPVDLFAPDLDTLKRAADMLKQQVSAKQEDEGDLLDDYGVESDSVPFDDEVPY